MVLLLAGSGFAVSFVWCVSFAVLSYLLLGDLLLWFGMFLLASLVLLWVFLRARSSRSPFPLSLSVFAVVYLSFRRVILLCFVFVYPFPTLFDPPSVDSCCLYLLSIYLLSLLIFLPSVSVFVSLSLFYIPVSFLSLFCLLLCLLLYLLFCLLFVYLSVSYVVCCCILSPCFF